MENGRCSHTVMRAEQMATRRSHVRTMIIPAVTVTDSIGSTGIQYQRNSRGPDVYQSGTGHSIIGHPSYGRSEDNPAAERPGVRTSQTTHATAGIIWTGLVELNTTVRYRYPVCAAGRGVAHLLISVPLKPVRGTHRRVKSLEGPGLVKLTYF